MGLLQKTNSVSRPTAKELKPLKDYEELPLPEYEFTLEIDDKPIALFQSISGISVKRDTESYAEGGHNEFTFEMPGRMNYGHITLKTGLTSSTFFWDWMMEGNFDGCARSLEALTLVQRRPDPKGGPPIYAEVKKWTFHNVFPVSWKIDDLSVTDSNSISMESLELSFDYLSLS